MTLPLADGDEVFHNAGEVRGLRQAAEGVVQAAVYRIEFVTERLVFGVGSVFYIAQRGHCALGGWEIGMASAFRSGENGGGDGGPEGAGLAGAGDLHRTAGDIGVDLHQERVFLRDAAAAYDAADRDAVLGDALDDRAGAEGGRLDEGAVDFRTGGVEGLADKQAVSIGFTRMVRLPLFQSSASNPLAPGRVAAASRVSSA